jgi:hypothetical protein
LIHAGSSREVTLLASVIFAVVCKPGLVQLQIFATLPRHIEIVELDKYYFFG